MYVDLVLYTDPKRPQINPKLDLFAWPTSPKEPNLVFPARVLDRVRLSLPERFRTDQVNLATWEYIVWQTEERGYTLVRSLDKDWWYWSMLADKFTLLDLARFLV
jgi:hypothetical protein